MKISELIVELQEAMNEHGDIEVCQEYASDGSDMADVSGLCFAEDEETGKITDVMLLCSDSCKDHTT